MAARRKPKKAKARSAKRSVKRSVKSAGPARAKTTRGFHLTRLAPSLTVDDLTKSLVWYTEMLGFKITQRWENEGRLLGVELKAGDVDIYLSQEDGSKGPRMKGQGFRLYWYTQRNIDQMADGIKARGGHLTSEPKDEWGVRSFSLVDPTGYLITISSER
jgi:uncharacterized glyoxalase superfamily protein PhnB